MRNTIQTALTQNKFMFLISASSAKRNLVMNLVKQKKIVMNVAPEPH